MTHLAQSITGTSSIDLLNLEDGAQATFGPIPNHAATTFENIFSPENTIGGVTPLSEKGRNEHVQQHINPLLMPDIKRAHDAIATMMNGPAQSTAR